MRKDVLVPWVGLSMLWTALILIVTGIVLYVVPPCWVASWTNWKLIGLNKTQWETLHTIFGFAFVILSLLHLWLNWGPIWTYFRRRVGCLLSSLAVATVLFVGSAAIIPPFSWIMELGENLSVSWMKVPPPVGRAEARTLAQLAKALKLSPEDIVRAARASGLKGASPGVKLGELAEKNGLSPEKAWAKISEKLNLK